MLRNDDGERLGLGRMVEVTEVPLGSQEGISYRDRESTPLVGDAGELGPLRQDVGSQAARRNVQGEPSCHSV